MGNCLVTKLKVSVNIDNADIFGAASFNIFARASGVSGNSSTQNTDNVGKIFLTTLSNKCKIMLDGDLYFTDSTYTTNEGKVKSSGAPGVQQSYYVKNVSRIVGDNKIIITDCYNLTNIYIPNYEGVNIILNNRINVMNKISNISLPNSGGQYSLNLADVLYNNKVITSIYLPYYPNIILEIEKFVERRCELGYIGNINLNMFGTTIRINGVNTQKHLTGVIKFYEDSVEYITSIRDKNDSAQELFATYNKITKEWTYLK